MIGIQNREKFLMVLNIKGAKDHIYFNHFLGEKKNIYIYIFQPEKA